MGKKQKKVLVPFSINEMLFVCRIAKMCGLQCMSIPSSTKATFNAVKITKGEMSKSNLLFIKQSFKEKFGKTLTWEIQDNLAYFSMQIVKKEEQN